MDILLWRWSTAVQFASASLIAVFFVVLSRSIRRPELRLWRRAWIANFLALVATLMYWYIQPQNIFAVSAVRGAYLGAKLAFVVFIVEGTWAARHAGRTLLSSRQRWSVIGAYTVAGGILLSSIMLLGFVQHGLLAAIFITTAILTVRQHERGSIWLAVGLTVRAIVAMAEAVFYAIAQNTPKTALGQMSAHFVAGSSSFDTGAEWLLTLGCVLVVSDRIQRELQQSNRELLAAQDELRALADRDPLTALSNRRVLPAALRNVQPVGATFLFFDLDHFKEINDVHGHEIGDQCLKTFANALQASFRPDDDVVRYGGDEFLVIASGLDATSIDDRIAQVRTRVRDSLAVPRIEFSVGRAYLEAGGRPEETIRAADAAMYTAKTA